MRPIVRGKRPRNLDGSLVKYSKYNQARGELIMRLGELCSYCEMHLDSALGVEHVMAKSPTKANGRVMRDRALNWYNFLLSCGNCNPTKGNKEVVLADYFWPDRDNTFRALAYLPGGVVRPASQLSILDTARAWAIIKLVGLDKQPNNAPDASDRRWANRREAWDMAVAAKADLATCDLPAMRRRIVAHAVSKGYWSIWMTVFQDDPDMLLRLIEAFPGTCADCFDANQGYMAIARPRGQC